LFSVASLKPTQCRKVVVVVVIMGKLIDYWQRAQVCGFRSRIAPAAISFFLLLSWE